MSFNPYEILANLRRNSNRDAPKIHEVDKSNINNLSGWRHHSNQTKNNFFEDTEMERSREKKELNFLPDNYQFDQPTRMSQANPLSESNDKSIDYDQQAAIRSYKNRLLQEIPELISKNSQEQDSLWSNHKSSQEHSLQNIRNGNELKYDLDRSEHSYKKAQDHSFDYNSSIKNIKRSVSETPSMTGTAKVREENLSTQKPAEKSMFLNNSKGSGTLRLGPFIHLKENFPKFPQSILKIDLRELENI